MFSKSCRYLGGSNCHREQCHRERGMTLVEVLIGVFVLMLVLVPSALFLGNLFKTTASLNERSAASSIVTGQSDCVKSLSTYPTSAANPVFEAADIGQSIAGSGSSTDFSSSQTSTLSTMSGYLPSGCHSSSGGAITTGDVQGGSGTAAPSGGINYNVATTTTLAVENPNASNGAGILNNTITQSNLENACYGFTGENQLVLQTTTTATWPLNGTTQKLSQSSIAIPPQIDIKVTDSYYPNGLPGATVSITPGVISSTGDTATTGNNSQSQPGCAQFVNYPPGQYAVTATDTVSGQTYTDSQTVNLSNGEIYPVILNINAPPSPCTSGCGGNNQPPTLTSISAPPWGDTAAGSQTGPWGGGNQVVLCGYNLVGVTEVSFANQTSGITSEATFTVEPETGTDASGNPTYNWTDPTDPTDTATIDCTNNSGQGSHVIVATVPPATSQSNSTADVTATKVMSSGSLTSSQLIQYNYVTSPFVSSMTVVGTGAPAEPIATGSPIGTPEGGTQLMLRGYNFNGASSVDFCIYLFNSFPCTGGSAPTPGTSGWSTWNGVYTQNGAVSASFTVLSNFEIEVSTPLDWACPNPTNLSEGASCVTEGWDLFTHSGGSMYASVWVTDKITAPNGQVSAERSDPYNNPNECQDGGAQQYPNGQAEASVNPTGQAFLCHFNYVWPPQVWFMSKQTGSNLLGPTYAPTWGGTVAGGNTIYLCPLIVNTGVATIDEGALNSVTQVTMSYTGDGGNPQVIPTSSWSEHNYTAAILDNGGPCDTYEAYSNYNYIQVTMPSSPFSGGGVGTVCIQGVNQFGMPSTCINDNYKGSLTTANGTYYNYVHTPIITSCVSPSSGYCGGSVGGGNTVTLYGNYFNGSYQVNFGCATATPNVISNTEIQVTAPPASYSLLGACTSALDGPEQVQLNVTNSAGTSNSVTYTYANTPSISDVSPHGGSIGGGTSVWICGNNLQSIQAVSFGGSPATVTGGPNTYGPLAYDPCGQWQWVTDQAIQVTTGASPNNGNDHVWVQVTNAAGMPSNQFEDNSDGDYTYANAPVIYSCVSPSSGYCGGSVGGGNTVTLYGKYFTYSTTVNFGCATATPNVISDTEIQVTAPPASYSVLGACTSALDGPEQVGLNDTNPVGTSNSVTYTYANTPSISDISPHNGPDSGGTSVWICGSNLQYIKSVSFGSSTITFGSPPGITTTTLWWDPCGNYVTSDQAIQVSTPPSPNGNYDQVNIQLTNLADQVSNAYGTYTYNPPAPHISSLSQQGGPESGGPWITIYGSDLQGSGFNTSVSFGCAGNASIGSWGFTGAYGNYGQEYLDVYPPDTYSLTGMCGNWVWPGDGGYQPLQETISISTIGGSNSWWPWTYQNGPSISGLSPGSGPTWGGNTVTINGNNFQYADGVYINGNWINKQYWTGGNSSISVTAPSDYCGYCEVTVQVIMPSGVGNTSYWGYVYEGSPSIGSLNPNNGGQCWDGCTTTNVTIDGSNLGYPTQVNFSGAGNMGINWWNSSQVNVNANDGWQVNCGWNSTVTVSTGVGTSNGLSFHWNSDTWCW